MKTLEVIVEGRSKNYKEVFYLVRGVYWKLQIPYWVKSFKKKEFKEWLTWKFTEYEEIELKITWNYC